MAAGHGVGYRPVPPNPPGPVPVFDPKTGKPIDYSKPQQRHVDTNTNAFSQQPGFGAVSDVLSKIGFVSSIIGTVLTSLAGFSC